MIFVLLGIVIVYVLTISWLIYGCSQVPLYSKKERAPKTTFSILVPFRNEAENLPLLLESIAKLKYPTDLFEVILIDDASEEKFSVLSSQFSVRIINTIRQSNSPKKDAITTGVPLAKNEWIVTTDADCIVPEHWLQTIDDYIQNHAVEMIASAVTYDCNATFLAHFQQLDLMSLQGATIGSFGINKGFMCNGANFAYTQSLFQKLNGFVGNDKIASGDDVFLLQKAIGQCPEKVHYLKSKDTIVQTQAVATWRLLFHQRVRWASKTSAYQSLFGKMLGLLVFITNFAWVCCFVLAIFGKISLPILGLYFLIKFGIDSVIISQTHRVLCKSKMRYWILSSLWYPFFSSAVALYSLFGKYEWKGRRF
jgi:glycosyltransferase involved in cell wall biosynthesis